MPSEDTKTSQFYQHWESDEKSSIIYLDFESFIKKMDRFKNILEKVSTTKVGKHIPCSFSMPSICTFDGTEKNYELWRKKRLHEKFL